MPYKSVTVYSTVVCPYCKIEKQWLEKNDVKYKNIFIDDDEDAAEAMIKKSKQMGVPVTVIVTKEGKEKVIVGFDKQELSKMLEIKE
jgi:glutaredoxin-like YruB-family protein